MIYDRTSMLTNFDVSCDARCAICCGQMTDQVHLKGIILLHSLTKYKSQITSCLCYVSKTKVISCSYCEILQCQSVSQCWSLYDCHTHKLLRPNGWLGSIERKYCLLLCGEIFMENSELFWGKMTSNTSMLSGSCWWYMIVEVCLLISMFPATPDAQSAAAKWLTRFILKVTFFPANVDEILVTNNEPFLCNVS